MMVDILLIFLIKHIKTEILGGEKLQFQDPFYDI